MRFSKSPFTVNKCKSLQIRDFWGAVFCSPKVGPFLWGRFCGAVFPSKAITFIWDNIAAILKTCGWICEERKTEITMQTEYRKNSPIICKDLHLSISRKQSEKNGVGKNSRAFRLALAESIPAVWLVGPRWCDTAEKNNCCEFHKKQIRILRIGNEVGGRGLRIENEIWTSVNTRPLSSCVSKADALLAKTCAEIWGLKNKMFFA